MKRAVAQTVADGHRRAHTPCEERLERGGRGAPVCKRITDSKCKRWHTVTFEAFEQSHLTIYFSCTATVQAQKFFMILRNFGDLMP